MAKTIGIDGFGTQPNAFDSAAIEGEVVANCPTQPAQNVPRGWSQTWDDAYQAAEGGQFIAAPYHDVKVTDPDKLAKATQAYVDWRTGKSATLPDIRDVFLDSGLRDMGFAPTAGADGQALLVQMCQQCHHASLDPTISREKFLVDKLSSMSAEEKKLAIERLDPTQTALTSRLTMPPTLFRTITDDERQAMIDALSK
jgi:hypothetical protein